MKADTKQAAVTMFLRGESVTDVGAFFAVTRSTVEEVLREAISGLARLNQEIAAKVPAPDSDPIPENYPSTGNTTDIEEALPHE